MPHREPVLSHEPAEQRDDWLEEPLELAPRPRRRLLGAGANPVALTLLGVLLIACGFIGGVLVEKGQSSSSSSASGVASSLASRFRALRGAAGTSAGGGSAAAVAGFTRPTAGTVAYLAGSTLYVTNAEGNTVKVTTSPGTSVSKTVRSSLKAIHPGETVTVTGASGADGSVSAEAISVGSVGGLAALFGGGGAGAGRVAGAGGGSAGGGGGGEPSLFGGG
jgi:hypothetical protein